MSKKLQKSVVKKKSSKKETNSVHSNGTINGLPSFSDQNSEDRAKDYKIEEINSQDEYIFNNAQENNHIKLEYFNLDILSSFQLQKIDEMVLSKDKNMLYMVTFLAKKDPTNEKKCICTSRDMKAIEQRCDRKYRFEYLGVYLSKNIN